MLEEIVEKEETPGEQPLSNFERERSLPPISKMDEGQALTEIAKTRADKEHPFNVTTHWHNRRAIDRVMKLYALAYPEPTKEDKEREISQVEAESKGRKEGFQTEADEKKRLEAEAKIKDEIERDPELVSKKIDYPTAVKIAQQVLQERGLSEEDKDFLDDTGYGNDPSLIKALLRIGLVEREKKEWLRKKRSWS